MSAMMTSRVEINASPYVKPLMTDGPLVLVVALSKVKEHSETPKAKGSKVAGALPSKFKGTEYVQDI